jgi:DHA2 family multidrug resistance protein
MYDMNAPAQQIRAMTIWGIGVTVAPVIGPALGGFLTESLNWRWVFFINVPIGALAAIGIFAIMPKFPAERRDFDHFGFVLVTFALCGLQLALDRGTQQDWLNSREIIIELAISAAAFWMLIFHLRRHPHPLIPIQLFQNPNFIGALILALVVSPVVVAGSALLPPFMQVLLGYPVMESGLLVMPRGIAMAIGMIVGGRLMQLFDGRLVIGLGLLVIIGGLWTQTLFTLQMDSRLIIWSGVLLGTGSGLSFATVNFVAVSSLPPWLRTDGAACYSLVRNLGTSLMITTMTALLARNTQINHAEIGSALHASSAPFLITQMLGGSFAADRLAEVANAEVTRQAVMVAYLDDFWLMMWLAIAVMPILFVLRPVRPEKGQRIEISE